MGITDSDKSFVHIAKISGADILSPDEESGYCCTSAAAHAAGLQVAPYTVNTVERWKKMAMHMWTRYHGRPAALLQWLRTQAPPLHP